MAAACGDLLGSVKLCSRPLHTASCQLPYTRTRRSRRKMARLGSRRQVNLVPGARGSTPTCRGRVPPISCHLHLPVQYSNNGSRAWRMGRPQVRERVLPGRSLQLRAHVNAMRCHRLLRSAAASRGEGAPHARMDGWMDFDSAAAGAWWALDCGRREP
jgi:hypothetical protein